MGKDFTTMENDGKGGDLKWGGAKIHINGVEKMGRCGGMDWIDRKSVV